MQWQGGFIVTGLGAQDQEILVILMQKDIDMGIAETVRDDLNGFVEQRFGILDGKCGSPDLA